MFVCVYDELMSPPFDFDMRFSGWKDTFMPRANIIVLFSYNTHVRICYDKICIGLLKLNSCTSSDSFRLRE